MLQSSWVHGNATVVESPTDVAQVTYRGWGADMFFAAKGESWFHIPLPTPHSVDGVTAVLERAHLMFSTEIGDIDRVVIYDGPTELQTFAGDWESAPTTPDGLVHAIFTLDRPHPVFSGIGITLLYVAGTNVDGRQDLARMTIAAAGADYDFPVRLEREIVDVEVVQRGR